ncbi:hypothetical protein C8R45DRAFT_1067903 [Mycena sanguinolenta]|nr:hypothetical protein C8R45DRAFT_1067903 [Mycena sanguinolenta]
MAPFLALGRLFSPHLALHQHSSKMPARLAPATAEHSLVPHHNSDSTVELPVPACFFCNESSSPLPYAASVLQLRHNYLYSGHAASIGCLTEATSCVSAVHVLRRPESIAPNLEDKQVASRCVGMVEIQLGRLMSFAHQARDVVPSCGANRHIARLLNQNESLDSVTYEFEGEEMNGVARRPETLQLYNPTEDGAHNKASTCPYRQIGPSKILKKYRKRDLDKRLLQNTPRQCNGHFHPRHRPFRIVKGHAGEYDWSAVELSMRNSEYQPSASLPNIGAVIRTLENGQHDTAVPAIHAYTGYSHETSSNIMPDDVHKPPRDSR